MIDKIKSVRSNAIITVDMSSAIGSRNLSKENIWEDLGVIYAGAQKNFGPSGLTFTIVREDIFRRVREIHSRSKLPIPIALDWIKSLDTKDFFPNTPASAAIWMSQLMCEHMLNMGGIDYYEQLAEKKANYLYDFIDKSP